MKKLFTLLFVCICFTTFGAYLENVPTQLKQPNGEVLNLLITGDEFFRRVHDNEGYSIVRGEGRWYYYAMYDAVKDQLVPSEYVVTANRNFALPMEKGLGISYEKYVEKRRKFYEPTGCDISGASKNPILKNIANSKTTQEMNNIVICIGFSDSYEMTNSFDYVNGLFNTNPDNNMRDFFATMSYNKLDVVSHFYPPADGNVLRFYQDPNPRAYYSPYNAVNNPIGYVDDGDAMVREHTLVANAVNWVNENWPVPTDLNLDLDNDGECDFISIVVHGPTDEWADLLWPHKWSLYTEYAEINGKRIWDYNFELDESTTYFSTNVFCHEGYHVLGAPDLYHYYNYTNIKAVNAWDIMDYSYLTKPQSMSAYMKYKYCNWVPTLPIATVNKTYEVFPFYFNDGTDPDKPVIYRIPMTGTSTQYSVVEYRKKKSTNYDLYLPNEGFLIYRINANMSGNAMFNATSVFDEVFLYRPGGTQTNGVYANGNFEQAPFNPSNGRTEFNSTTNPKPCQSNGTAETEQNINNILYDSETDSYTFFYGNPETRNMAVTQTTLLLQNFIEASGNITVTSNVLWRVSIPAEATSWLAVSNAKGLNDGFATFTTLSDNVSEEPRSAIATFSGNNQTFYVNIIQQGVNDDIIVVSVSANPEDGGTVAGGGNYGTGEQVTVTATANDGYLFLDWTNGTAQASENPIFEFIASENVTLVANFELKNYTVSITANPADGGTFTGDGAYYHGETATLKATPATGYIFVNWTEDTVEVSANSTFNIEVKKNMNLVANFVEKVGINEFKTSSFTVYPNPANNQLHIVRAYVGKAHVEIFNSLGALVQSLEINDIETTINVTALSPGVYAIRLTDSTSASTLWFVKE